jgi:hypothetical protein
VLPGRLKAVLVAIFATIVLAGAIVPAATFASDPPGLARFMWALGKVESGGDYYARNDSSGAYGKYQIMPSSWRAWADRYLGDANAKPSPANQDVVAAAKLRALHAGLGTWRRTAYWWLTGSSRTTGWSSYATRYVLRVMALYGSKTDAEVAALVKPKPVAKPVPVVKPAPGATLTRFSERSPRIAYTGTWKSAGHPRYDGDAAAYATAAGATATFRFTGKRVTWYGPVGPTRGKAKVSVDGRYVKTVDLYATSFSAHKSIFSSSWSTAGAHTLVISVVGTAGRPYVAIDGFAVAN